MKMSINLDVNSMAFRLTRDLEVRYENIRMVAECEVVHGKPLLTIWNYTFGYCRNFRDEQPISVKFLSVEVRYENIRVVAECEVVHGKPLPTI
ncbi:hypothetical protein HanHA300_Chr11g0389921 [Helianthus annuus]|nr:hypothetical protein HanHA300_Chr11g0389921 [Helianthus annuus]KAJ0688294.1 hypothetical protein HanOQP8_Chr11g0392771 [Helianthus annuus]